MLVSGALLGIFLINDSVSKCYYPKRILTLISHLDAQYEAVVFAAAGCLSAACKKRRRRRRHETGRFRWLLNLCKLRISLQVTPLNPALQSLHTL